MYRGGAIKSEPISRGTGKNIPRTCLNNLSDFRMDVDVTHVVVDASGGTLGSYVQPNTKAWEEEECLAFAGTRSNGVANGETDYCRREEKASLFNISYSFSKNKGFLYLEPTSLLSRNVTSQYAIISTNDVTCFSDDPLLRYVGHSLVGVRDTVAMNWILGFVNGNNGFIYNHKSGDLIDLEGFLNEYSFRWPTMTRTTSNSNSPIESTHNNDFSDYDLHNMSDDGPTYQEQHGMRWHHHYLVFKSGVLVSSLFLFFLTTTLVSFTLRETQNRMLHFTLQLQFHIRRRQPYGNLIVTHVVENMVFVPIMIGIIFFLTDCFYSGDKFLAFVILSGIWVCEVFSAVRYDTQYVQCKRYLSAIPLYCPLSHISITSITFFHAASERSIPASTSHKCSLPISYSSIYIIFHVPLAFHMQH